MSCPATYGCRGLAGRLRDWALWVRGLGDSPRVCQARLASWSFCIWLPPRASWAQGGTAVRGPGTLTLTVTVHGH